MKRFTISLYDVVTDYESTSWLAPTADEADAIRLSLKTLGFPFSEDEVPSEETLFHIVVINSDRGSRTAYLYRTKDEVESIVSANLGGFHALPADRSAALTRFLNRPDDPGLFMFNDFNTELSVERMHPEPPTAAD